MKSYKDLIVWQKSYLLTKKVYLFTKSYPREELYSLTSQMRRAALTIPSNIAEGFTRNHSREFLQFLYIAFSSGAELETQIELSKDMGYLTNIKYMRLYELLNEVMKMLNVLISKIKKSSH